ISEDQMRAGVYSPTYQGQLASVMVNLFGTGGISSTAEYVVRFSQIFMGQGKEILYNKAVKAMEQEEDKKGMCPGDCGNVFK
ncbi:serine hydrolase, partial [Bacillus cereus]|nr:serine hydrolase [Bacillus cereus]